jgi:hypothetical protein
MRLLIVENKFMTLTWSAIARQLPPLGFEIHWLVQNPLFKPTSGTSHVLPFPSMNEWAALPHALAHIAQSDRNVQYFGGNAHHYAAYWERINALLGIIKPTAVIGEPTLFHELLTIEACKIAGIPYLFPMSVRFPANRFAFFLGETQETVAPSGDRLPEHLLENYLDLYEKRGAPPLFYSHLSKNPVTRLHGHWQRSRNALISLASVALGERFNTPTPLTKLRLNAAQRAMRTRWDAAAARGANSKKNSEFRVLYPLQMQPESNLDVQGRPHRNQSATIRAILAATPNNVVVQIKPNPVPRYEIDEDLLALVESETRAHALGTTVMMDDVFWAADLIVTVTGSVAFEGLFSGKPTVALAPTAPTRTGLVPFVTELSSFGEVIEQVQLGKWRTSTREQRRSFLERQISTSHPGLIADSINYPPVLNTNNIAQVSLAFERLQTHLCS